MTSGQGGPPPQKPLYVGAIDQGTSSCRFALFNHNGQLVDSHQIEMKLISPKPGWVEHDPMYMLEAIQQCIDEVMTRHNPDDVCSVGITNQRETTILWDSVTGNPLYHAILWLDVRTSDICREIEAQTGSRDFFRNSCGLPISTYFSATKILWLMQNVPEVREAMANQRCMFGTVDSWIIYNLTGGASQGGVHVTDVSNASRTMLMNLSTLSWDNHTCAFFGIPQDILPSIRSNSEEYGFVSSGRLAGVPIAGCLGDQHAAMVGQLCHTKGGAKNTYGTGAFMLLNTGTRLVKSRHGLLTTVCAKLGPDADCTYALEGSIAVAGSGVQWLRDNLGVISSAAEINELAVSVKDTGDVYFVTAFSGLFAPHWRDDARGTIVGLTQYSNRGHIARSVLEAVCYRTREILDSMVKDSGVKLDRLRVDGGMTASDLMLQIQSDILNMRVERPAMLETTCLGAAIAAGLASKFWGSMQEVAGLVDSSTRSFLPEATRSEVDARFGRWKLAVQRSLGWTESSTALVGTETRSESPQGPRPCSYLKSFSRPALLHIGTIAVISATLASIATVAVMRRGSR